MIERVIIAGAGGQGIMVLGRVLAVAAMRENRHVTWIPAYGAEVRGGTSHCMVIISDQEVSSPFIDQADTIIIMNEPSLKKFKSRLTNKGLLIINSSLVAQDKDLDKNSRVIKHPFTDIAIRLGNIKIANIVALGCYLVNKRIVTLKNVLKAIEDIAPEDKKDLIEINKKAISAGMKLDG